MKKLTLAILAASLLACLFVSCGDEGESPVGEWSVVSFEKDGAAQYASDATLSIAKKNSSTFAITGYSGVNNYFGQIKVSKGQIKMTDKFGSTMMAGPEEDMNFESSYFDLIATADDWKTYTSDGKECLEISSSSADAKVIFEKR